MLDVTVPAGRWESQAQRSAYDLGSGVERLGFGSQLHYLLAT